MDDLVLHPGPGTHRRTLGRARHALEQPQHGGGVRVPHVVVDLREVRHDVGRETALRDHVVDPRLLRNVLAHEVHHVVHRLDPVERAPSPLRRARRVRGIAPEAELGGLVGQRPPHSCAVPRPGMPVQRHGHVVEQARPHHVHLPRAPFLGGRAVEPDRPLVSRLLQPFLDRDGRRHGARAEQMVSARVARAADDDGRAHGHGVLGDARQRVVLGQDPDDRTSGAVARHERRGHVGDAGFDREPRRLEFALQQLGTLLLLVADLGPLPDLARHAPVVVAARLDRSDLRLLGRHEGQREYGHEGAGEESAAAELPVHDGAPV